MNRRALIVFVVLNIVISIGVALLVIAAWQSMQGDPLQEPAVQVFEVIITVTPGPTQTPWIITEQGDGAVAAVPTSGSGGTGDEPTVAPTLNEEILPFIATSAAETQVAIQSSGSEEQTYTVQSGDSPASIAEAFELSVDDLLCANDLGTVDDPEFIFPGQALLIPGSDFECVATAPLATETPTPEPTSEETEEAEATDEDGTASPRTPSSSDAAALNAAATAVPTITLAPTAADAQVTIVQVIAAGDVTSEGVEIRNQGGLVDLAGWTLFDTEGNTYTFPDYRLFSSAGVTIYTRVGEDTPVGLYWGETRAVWQAGDVISLANADGEVQSTLRVAASATLRN
jgi:LysM repeat protein